MGPLELESFRPKGDMRSLMTIKTSLIWALRCNQTRAFIRNVSDCESRLDRFNAIWRDATENVPFYAEWKARHNLPDKISNLVNLSFFNF